MAILIIGFSVLVAAFFLIVIGLVYSELMNSDIPCGAAHIGKLLMVYGLFVSMAAEFTQEQKIANSTSRVDYRPHWDFKPDVLERRSALLRAEGLPFKMVFGHHYPLPSDVLATEYKQSYAKKYNNYLQAMRHWGPDNFTREREKSNFSNSAYTTVPGPLKSTNHSCEKLHSQLPTLTVNQSTYQNHALGAYCKNRFARASRTLSSHLYPANHINKDLDLRQRLLLQVPDMCFSQEMIK